MRDIGRNQDQKSQVQLFNEGIIKKIFDGDVEKLNEYCDYVGKELADKEVSNSQLRGILDEVQKIFRKKSQEEQDKFALNVKNRLELMKPKLAYLVGKEKKYKKIEVLKQLNKILSYAIDQITQKNLEIFKYFMEAIVAYHRFYEKGGQ